MQKYLSYLLLATALILASTALTLTASAKDSASGKSGPSMKAVHNLYSSGQYKDALKLIGKMPQSDLTHYYSGLSYQGLNQTSRASAEYNWVVSYSKNAQLRQNASRALKSVRSYSRARTYSGNGNVYARYNGTAAASSGGGGGGGRRVG
ncbi:MAG: hypothetical protein H6677_08265 [Candidatus Obscuribacterales bacterium]|nr:hypothetical protein [Candidatus Obscuribacterales bacterium]